MDARFQFCLRLWRRRFEFSFGLSKLACDLLPVCDGVRFPQTSVRPNSLTEEFDLVVTHRQCTLLVCGLRALQIRPQRLQPPFSLDPNIRS
jgi:hypothetical protein